MATSWRMVVNGNAVTSPRTAVDILNLIRETQKRCRLTLPVYYIATRFSCTVAAVEEGSVLSVVSLVSRLLVGGTAA